MPEFNKKTGNTANLKGSEFYGYGNQFQSPLTKKIIFTKTKRKRYRYINRREKRTA